MGRLVTTQDGDGVFVVSIQLISPASGEYLVPRSKWHGRRSFHSINFPSEWGAQKENNHRLLVVAKVSIQLISPASGEQEGETLHLVVEHQHVSIQLISPASGEHGHKVTVKFKMAHVSIQLISPASGEALPGDLDLRRAAFPFN